MPYAEEELTIVLRERSKGASVNPGRVHQVVRRGRSIRRRRRLAAAVGGVATVCAIALTLHGGAAHEPADDAVPVAVRLPMEVSMPAAARGVVSSRMPLVVSAQRQRMGENAMVRFTALSTGTMFNVRCAVPNSWLITRLDTPGRPGSIGRCGPADHLSQLDRASAGSSWVGTVRTLEVWVLPPQALVDEATKPDEIPVLAAKTGVWDGAWAVGVYDS
ncbi:hypothetical protein [Actinomadura rubrisoli]|uniref:Uncharacterized protein n=1 Tax=Actinomadura rubrisoli TaxID=2530368 RepID=A0A4V2YYQ8_9ACTN|nr:hypothetical protein [Actinomadura rubrisoli]TDD94167.1 hypothetical protein E1298_07640 [Actinomadura rubrisoli]